MTVTAGDVVLIRSGWGQQFDEGAESYLGFGHRRAGRRRGRRAVAGRPRHSAPPARTPWPSSGSPPGRDTRCCPAHRVLLVEHGIYIVEALNLEELAAAGLHEFTVMLSPLNLIGATGSPVRPLAVVGHG